MRSKNVLTVLAAAILAGCGGLSAGPKSPLPDLDLVIEGQSGRPETGLQASYAPEKVRECMSRSLNTDAARDCRDQIVQMLMTAINLRYAEYERGFYDANRYGNFGATIGAIGLGFAGSVTTGGAPQILSGLAALVTGARAEFNREVMQEQTAAALLTAMRTQRNNIDLRLRAGLRQSALEYPLGVALSDVFALYRAGTIPGAIAGVTQAVGSASETVQKQLSVDTGATPPMPEQVLAAARPAVTTIQSPALRPAAIVATPRTPAQPFGQADTPAAIALRAWVDGLDVSAAERRARRQRLVLEATVEGLPNPTVASVLRDKSADNLVRLDRIARRVGLMPGG